MIGILPDVFVPTMWASLLANDLTEAKTQIVLTTLSAQAPRSITHTPHGALWREIEHAAKRGIQVTIIMAAPQTAHPATARNLSAAQWLHERGMRGLLVPGPCLLHQKTACVDQKVGWIGSGNLTAAACNHNHELFARITDRGAVEQIYLRMLRLAELAGARLAPSVENHHEADITIDPP